MNPWDKGRHEPADATPKGNVQQKKCKLAESTKIRPSDGCAAHGQSGKYMTSRNSASTPSSESGDSNRDGLGITMTDADIDPFYASLLGSNCCFTVQLVNR